jgi:hypothetical protein
VVRAAHRLRNTRIDGRRVARDRRRRASGIADATETGTVVASRGSLAGVLRSLVVRVGRAGASRGSSPVLKNNQR